jgi:hypothetical protein
MGGPWPPRLVLVLVAEVLPRPPHLSLAASRAQRAGAASSRRKKRRAMRVQRQRWTWVQAAGVSSSRSGTRSGTGQLAGLHSWVVRRSSSRRTRSRMERAATMNQQGKRM